jgi:hypothetical protein
MLSADSYHGRRFSILNQATPHWSVLGDPGSLDGACLGLSVNLACRWDFRAHPSTLRPLITMMFNARLHTVVGTKPWTPR